MYNPFRKLTRSRAQTIPQSTAGIEPERAPAARPDTGRRITGVLVGPHRTEKTASVPGWYGFRVEPSATKISVRRAIEARYGVKVEKVRVSNLPGKRVRVAGRTGMRPGIRKAMVKLAAGQTLNIS